MKFTDGFWQLRPGVTALYAQEAYDIWQTDTAPDGAGLVVTAPTAVIAKRGDVLNRAALTVTLSSPIEGVVRVRIAHHEGGAWHGGFELPGAAEGGAGTADAEAGTLTTGPLTARIAPGAPWSLAFEVDGERVTGSGHKAQAFMRLSPDAAVDHGIVGNARADTGLPEERTFVHEQLDLGVGETIYGLGERFGPYVKNGQSVDIWNADGGTSSEQAYKSVPFYLSSRGYGLLVNDPGHVSFEVGSESVERVQFAVTGEVLEYFVFAGPTPRDVLARYTALTGRPPVVPAWSYGTWLSTSFTTDYDEATVTSFIEGMAERDLPLSVFHFDCFWMREFNWCDFEWDARVFPDPEGMLARLRERRLRISVWINPYIAQRSPLFAEAAASGYLVTRADGSVWQWDLWQAGMGLVDFTNPDATAWFQSKLRRLMDQGVDCFKTDFGERIPTDVVWHDGSDPARMHNLYTQLYNRAVHDLLVAERGEGDAVLFARSATAGGQTMPVHWGGDSTSTFASMAESLRGGLSLAMSGFAHWSHDIGGFEGTPDAAVFKRWTAFGLLSSHSRFHGSESYRVPWAFDDEAVDVTRTFSQLKMRLMPYLYQLGLEAAQTGAPVMRPMQFEFPADPAVAYLDRQYLLGPDVLVAPVFTETGDVDFYLPAGEWTSLLTGETVQGGGWRRERHGFDSLPLYARPGAVIPWGARSDRADYDYLEGLQLRVFPGGSGTRDITVTAPDGRAETFTVDLGDVTR
ncbi:alpha-xylosidase [Microbacterium terricola]|uniref:Alpha-xylosidase n=1 Tax=Microbacterium terricola TaxID=344163 RepID=A0ABM8E1Q3_9MICO|nr:alpha-xylosidase [Microbacterium terricola]UYK40557.1 alpha-xylosidase [Microbacterium terricola]BDV31716.1 alpha-xylosidase [Microbacterium terricola]